MEILASSCLIARDSSLEVNGAFTVSMGAEIQSSAPKSWSECKICDVRLKSLLLDKSHTFFSPNVVEHALVSSETVN